MEFLLWRNGIGSISGALDTDLIPGLAQWVKDLAWPQLQLWLGSDSWPRNSVCCGTARKEEREREREKKKGCIWLYANYASIQLIKEINSQLVPVLTPQLPTSVALLMLLSLCGIHLHRISTPLYLSILQG